MGGIVIKPKIIIVTKKKLMIYAVLLIIMIIAIATLVTTINNKGGVESSGYTYLKYKDGIYIGSEKTEYGNIKAEVTIANEIIKDIKLIELPQKYIKDDATLKDEIPQLIYGIIQSQNLVQIDNSRNSGYILNKISKAVRNALDQSLLGQ